MTNHFIKSIIVLVAAISCGFNISLAQELKGDLNGDGAVNVTDINVLVDIIYGNQNPGGTTDPVTDDSKVTYHIGDVEFSMIKVEGGSFVMGGDTEPYAHVVELSTYYIGETEVTQELYQAVMGSNPSYFTGAKLPVEQVSWSNAYQFCNKLSQLTGVQFSLPTEAQWEFAALGGNKSNDYLYSGSNNLSAVAWWSSNSSNKTHEVATKQPNELGIYDMSGNVMEWCKDNYEEQYPHTTVPLLDPEGPSSYNGGVVFRNGGYASPSDYCRSKRRQGIYTSASISSLGFRIATVYPAGEQTNAE